MVPQAFFIADVGAGYPETAEWFYSPLGTLCTDQPVGMDKIKEIYCELRPDLRALFVLDEKAKFWRQPIDDQLCDELIDTRGMDGLIALSALFKEAEITQNRDLHETASWALVERLLQAKTDEVILSAKVRETLAQWASNRTYGQNPNQSAA
jgi:hypothetical protein